MEINYRELIKKSHTFRKDEYIKYFFKNIVGTDESPIYGKEDSVSSDYFDISIVKNTKEERSKVGNVYLGKYWRTCIFYFVDRNDAYKYLNPSGKEEYSFKNGIISWKDENGFVTNSIEPRSADSVNHNVFKYFKKSRSSWFVRSFVYFVLVICDEETPISSKDFYIHYWNSKYEFKKAKKTLLFGKSKKVVFVEDVSTELNLIKDENKESIDCVRAYFGKLEFFQENEEAFTDIKKDIDDGVPYILCQGAARTGKTILALRLLNEYKDFKLLLMNYSFYVSLRDAFAVLEKPFPSDRIYHHDIKHRDNGCWITGLDTKSLRLDISKLIVDEAQRLGALEETYTYRGYHLSGFDAVDTIVNYQNHIQTVFFGDDSQMLNPKYDLGIKNIKEKIGDRDYREYYFSSPLGVPQEILKNVKFLLNYEKTQPYPLNNFSISIEKDPEKFIKRYLDDEQRKKHLVVSLIGDVNIDSVDIGGVTFKSLKNANISRYLFNETVQKEHYLTAYSVISREIESVYLFMPKHIYLDDNESIQSRYSKDNSFLMKHLYTIMTRATMSLVICCEDEKLGEYFNERIEAIKAEEEKEENDEPVEYDYNVFIAYFGTDRPEGTYNKAKEICEILKAKGLSVFLNNYSFLDKDSNLRFTETWHALNRSETTLFVFNEFVDKDQSGLIKRETGNGEASRIYQELAEFQNLIDSGLRKAKYDARFYYEGKRLNKFTIYPFLNKYYPPLTQGNSNCCFLNLDEMLKWIDERFSQKEENEDA